ncbi:unnamed protein product [Acanthosepion pharaonis]|uniref:UBX domain-containing protein n=1 Tax=Acanthosepion pharaonis TaxID=158019 RepID=A0A812CPF6_ACAPH|nr:unnamed protein product [Sepia pharaonis]
MTSPHESLQHRQNSYYEDSGEELSPRQQPSQCSLSKYKPLPAIKGKNHRGPSPDILRNPTVSHTEDTVMHTKKKGSPHETRKPDMELKGESPMLLEINHPKQTTNHLANPHLVQKESSPNPTEPYGNNEELPPQSCPPNSTSWSELPDLNNFPDEPGPEEARTLLAIKLPNGQRIHRFFRLKDPLWLVRRFAEVSSSNDFSNFQLVKSIPCEILNLNQTIEENHLLEKILLHLEIFTHDRNIRLPNSS